MSHMGCEYQLTARMRRLHLHRQLSGQGLPTPSESIASGSMDSYHLPEPITAGLSGGSSPKLVESPGSTEMGSVTPERPNPFQTLPPITTELSTSPSAMETLDGAYSSHTERAGEEIATFDSPVKHVASPTECAAPAEVDSPVECISPVEVDSPVQA